MSMKFGVAWQAPSLGNLRDGYEVWWLPGRLLIPWEGPNVQETTTCGTLRYTNHDMHQPNNDEPGDLLQHLGHCRKLLPNSLPKCWCTSAAILRCIIRTKGNSKGGQKRTGHCNIIADGDHVAMGSNVFLTGCNCMMRFSKTSCFIRASRFYGASSVLHSYILSILFGQIYHKLPRPVQSGSRWSWWSCNLRLSVLFELQDCGSALIRATAFNRNHRNPRQCICTGYK